MSLYRHYLQKIVIHRNCSVPICRLCGEKIFIVSFSENMYKIKLNKSIKFQQLSVEKIINELSIEDLTKEEKIALNIIKK